MIPDESADADIAVHSGIKATALAAATDMSASAAPVAPSDHLTMLSAGAAAAVENGTGALLQQAQAASQLLQTTMPAAGTSPGLALSAMALPDASTADLAEGFELASLHTPVVVSPPINNDPAAAAALATVAVPTQLQLQLQQHQQQLLQQHNSSLNAPLHMHGSPSTTLVSTQLSDVVASGTIPPGVPAGSGAPILPTDAQSLAQHIDIATAAAAAAATQLNTPSHMQAAPPQLSTGLAGLSAQQVTASMMQAAGSHMLAPTLATVPGAAADGLGITAAQLPTTPATTPGTQTIQAQQQAALAAAISNSVNAGIQLGATMQLEHPQSLVAAAPTAAPAVHTHSRSISVVDGMVAMYPNDGSNSVTPRSGIVMTSVANAPVQPTSAQIQQHLQHQMELDKGHALSDSMAASDSKVPSAFVALSQQPHSGALSTSASTVASAIPSGVPSPYATPSITAATGAMAGGHRRQLSCTFPATIPQQQQAQAMMCIDTTQALNTAHQTLVPGTPTTFGQLQYPMPASGAHHGHSRHLSLDTANFRLMSADIGSIHGVPLQGPFHEHSAEAINALQLETVRSFAAIQQQQLHQMQAQVHAQAQAQQKAPALAVRTVPVTPQNPMAGGMFSTVPQPAALSDSLAQHQQQLQAQGQHQHQRHLAFHHGSSSVDLGSLASSLSIAQFNQTLSGQMSPAGVHPSMATMAGMSQMQLPQQPAQFMPSAALAAGITAALSVSLPAAAGADAVALDEFEDEDEDDGDGDEETDAAAAAEDSAKDAKKSAAKVSKSKKPKAPYKRFRNSFIFFANERRKQWRREHPEVTKIQNRGFIQEMSKVWNSMTNEEKAPYASMADEDKLRYEADVKKYGPLPTSTSTSAQSKEPTDSRPAKAKLPRSSATSAAASAANSPGIVPIAPAPLATVSTDIALAPTAATAASEVYVPMLTTAVVNPGLLSAPAGAATSIGFESLAQPLIVSPTPHSLAGDTFEIDPANQMAYQALLQQALGQDFSPHAVEFDPSCFVNSEPMATDEPACANPALLTTPTECDPAQVSAFDGASRSHSGSPSSALLSTAANGPPITTLVGTKRKSGSDGLPMTSLPTSIKRFRNSFIYYVNEMRRAIQFDASGLPTNIEVNNREFLKEMSAKWRVMTEDDKAPYLEMANQDKARFARQMREYEIEHPDEFQQTKKHRRRRSSGGTGVSSSMSSHAEAAMKQHEQRMAAQLPTAENGATSAPMCGLNISLGITGAMPASAPATISAGSSHVTTGHVPSLPSVPEEAAICTEAMEICSDASMAGPTASSAIDAALSELARSYTTPATMPATSESAREDS